MKSKGAILRDQPEASALPAGDAGPIGSKEVQEAEIIRKKYKDGKTHLEERVKINEQLFKLMTWGVNKKKHSPGDPMPVSAYLFNSIINKHADAMDNIPTLTVLPREEMDKQDADVLTSVLPAVLEQNDFDEIYDNLWWEKLKSGTGVYGVFWDSKKQNGLGDIDIRVLDLLNLFWEPGIVDIQKSRNLFHVDLMDRDIVQQTWPDIKINTGAPAMETAKYIYDDTVNTDNKVAVVDWYYKARIDGREVVHYCKYTGGQVLYASENQPDTEDEKGNVVYSMKERGYYDHGKYPVVFDTTFPVKGTPAGMGFVDICRNPQEFVDSMDQTILKAARWNSMSRYFETEGSGINRKDFLDENVPIVGVKGSRPPNEMLMLIDRAQLPAECIAVRNMKVEEIKETSGNRDFSQGSTASGVTAASAIAALQEAGSKTSRDIISASYRAFREVGYIGVELMRQFYTEPRIFRIIGKNGEMEFKQFQGMRIAEQMQGDGFVQDSFRVPIFDVRVVAQKQSPFSTVVLNERAKELYGMGFFRPDLADQAFAALSMMQFEGVEAVRERILQNGLLYQRMTQLTPLIIAMAQELDMIKGTQYTQQVAQMLGNEMQSLQTDPSAASRGGGRELQSNAIGDTFNETKNSTAGAARQRAAEVSTPRA